MAADVFDGQPLRLRQQTTTVHGGGGFCPLRSPACPDRLVYLVNLKLGCCRSADAATSSRAVARVAPRSATHCSAFAVTASRR